jgi:hypothetical protein
MGIPPDWARLWYRTVDALQERQAEGKSTWLRLDNLKLSVEYSESKSAVPVSLDLTTGFEQARMILDGKSASALDYIGVLTLALSELAWQQNPQCVMEAVFTTSIEITYPGNYYKTRTAPLPSNTAFKSSLNKYLDTLDGWIVEDIQKNANQVPS